MSSSNLRVIYQDREVVVVDKPVGMSIHNDDSSLIATLGNVLPVHRLDKETSGVQILAKNSEAARVWATPFQLDQVAKIYVAVLRGSMEQSLGIWKQPLTDKAEGRSNPAGKSADRVPCETHFRALKNSKFFSLLELDLKTGRQHQIRKHAALSGHAIVGDPRYGDPRYNGKMATFYGTDRMFLHCQSIQIKGQKFESPVPEEFDRLFKTS